MTYTLYAHALYVYSRLCSRPFSGLRGSLTGVVSLIVLLLLALPGSAAAQGRNSEERDSVRADIVFKSTSEPRVNHNFCFANAIGVHPDPVGNGLDSDYSYSRSPVSRTPPDWTGLQDVIPGERITYLVAGNSGGDGGGLGLSCGEQLARLKDGYENVEVWAYYTPPSNRQPKACFTFEEVDEPLAVDFDASCSNDPDGDVVQYDWDFGGAGSGGGSGAQTRFTYEEPGTYTVTLVVTDDDGDQSAPFTEEVEVGDVLVVNSTGDDPDADDADKRCDTGQKVTRDGEEEDECTLRAAIEEANERGGGTITFDIPGGGVPSIVVEHFDETTLPGSFTRLSLPMIKTPITIDGTTQSGGGWVELVGTASADAQHFVSGLYVSAAGAGSAIRGMVIHGFTSSAIRLAEGADRCVIEGNRIGTDATGMQWRGNGGRSADGPCCGVMVNSSSNRIAENLIAGNTAVHERLDGQNAGGVDLIIYGHNNVVEGNRIGVGADGRPLQLPPRRAVRYTSASRSVVTQAATRSAETLARPSPRRPVRRPAT